MHVKQKRLSHVHYDVIPTKLHHTLRKRIHRILRKLREKTSIKLPAQDGSERCDLQDDFITGLNLANS